jgi:hypothetical protein
MKAPFPYFGGKRRVADLVWAALGDVDNYVEPFAGSLAVLLERPEHHGRKAETVNDADAYLSNFWRALAADPEEVARWADWPVNECVASGTIVATPRGPRRIETLRRGDAVWGYSGGRVVQTTVLATKCTTRTDVQTVAGMRITPDHPVWTTGGYKAAASLTHSDTLAVLECEYGPRVDYLRFGASIDQGSAVYRRDVPRQAIVGAPVPRADGRANTPRLLDSVAVAGGTVATMDGAGDGPRKRLAGSRKTVDCTLSQTGPVDQSHEWRRRDTGIKADASSTIGTLPPDAGKEISARPGTRDVGKEAHSRGQSEDGRSITNAASHNILTSCSLAVSKGSGYVRCNSCVGTRANRSSVKQGASGKNCGQDQKPKGALLRGNRRAVPFNNSGGKISRRLRNEHISIIAQRLSVQGTSVFDLATTTGNFFANGILVHNCDLIARHLWLVNEGRERIARMEADPDFFDAKVAGWWVWGINAWIGSGWCSGNGPWIVRDGECVDSRKLPHLGDAGQGVNRQLPHLGDAGQGVNRQLPHLGDAGQGVNRKLPHLGDAGRGVHGKGDFAGGGSGLPPNVWTNETNTGNGIRDYFNALASRLRRVRVCCGDWRRVLTRGALAYGDTVGVFLDPPYLGDVRTRDLYRVDNHDIADAVREWAIANGNDRHMRIVLAGYADEHDGKMPDSWLMHVYSGTKAYGTTGAVGSGRGNDANRHEERLWFSPGCLNASGTNDLFALATEGGGR